MLSPAKINLFLHVLEKRSNGYHSLESLVTFSNIGDKLFFNPNKKKLSLSIYGLYAYKLANIKFKDNLIIKAVLSLSKYLNIQINGHFVLIKNLPVSSGIGGGSSNAAAAIKLLLKYFKINIDIKLFNIMLLSIGADVPVCFKNKNIIMSGIGEKLKICNGLPTINAILVNPNFDISTIKIFKKLNIKNRTNNYKLNNLKFNNYIELIKFLKNQCNDMQEVVIDIYPEIQKVLFVLKNMKGILLNRMSGSGSTCFGLFIDSKSAKIAAKKIQNEYSNWWVKECKLSV